MTLATRKIAPEFSGSPQLSASADGVTYTIEGTADLVNFDQPVSKISPYVSNLPALDDALHYEYRSFALPDAGSREHAAGCLITAVDGNYLTF
ncbi:MAG TPA: hypothetical protein VF258_04965 [Luteolibacter sp.]